MDNSKMVKTANALDIFAKVCGGIFRVVGFVCLVFAVLVLVLGEKMFAEGSYSLDSGFLKLYLADGLLPDMEMMKLYAIITLLVVAVLCFAVHFICLYLRAVFTPMKEGRPFEADIPIYLRRIAWLTLIAGFIIQAAEALEGFILTRAYPMEELFSSEAIGSVEYSFSMDFSFVLLFCAFMLLSYIFSYGRALQQESDETL